MFATASPSFKSQYSIHFACSDGRGVWIVSGLGDLQFWEKRQTCGVWKWHCPAHTKMSPEVTRRVACIPAERGGGVMVCSNPWRFTAVRRHAGYGFEVVNYDAEDTRACMIPEDEAPIRNAVVLPGSGFNGVEVQLAVLGRPSPLRANVNLI